MRRINLNPTGRDVVKITYPPVESRRRAWLIETMRFIPHDGRAK